MFSYMNVEESPGSRKQGVQRKLERATASQSHRDYDSFLTERLGKESEKRQSSPLQPPNGALLPASGSAKA